MTALSRNPRRPQGARATALDVSRGDTEMTNRALIDGDGTVYRQVALVGKDRIPVLAYEDQGSALRERWVSLDALTARTSVTELVERCPDCGREVVAADDGMSGETKVAAGEPVGECPQCGGDGRWVLAEAPYRGEP